MQAACFELYQQTVCISCVSRRNPLQTRRYGAGEGERSVDPHCFRSRYESAHGANDNEVFSSAGIEQVAVSLGRRVSESRRDE